MKSLFLATAMLSLLGAASNGLAQTATTTTPAQNAAICPAPGSVPDAQLTSECRNQLKNNTSTMSKDTTATGVDPTTKTDAMTTGSLAAASKSDSILASQFMGQTVYSPANETVGEINDVVMTKNLDNIVAIIGVGGFLGIGEKDVAIPLHQLTATKDQNNKLRVTINANKQQLEATPSFDRSALK